MYQNVDSRSILIYSIVLYIHSTVLCHNIHLSAMGVAEIEESTNLKWYTHTAVYIVYLQNIQMRATTVCVDCCKHPVLLYQQLLT
jgi:hypothetical protein